MARFACKRFIITFRIATSYKGHFFEKQCEKKNSEKNSEKINIAKNFRFVTIIFSMPPKRQKMGQVASHDSVQSIQPRDENSITFRVSDVKVNPIDCDPQDFKAYKRQVLRASRDQVCLEPNGFIHAIVTAYSHHHHLVLTPDQVWLWIIKVFADYVEANHEKLRPLFVSHEGKQEIKVTDVGNVQTYPIPLMMEKFDHALNTLVTPMTQEWIVPNFSTTGALERTIGRMMMLSALQHYFSYKMQLCCGLPSVTLKGTVKDWEQLYLKAQRLTEFGMGEWSERLNPILQKFVESAQGKPDVEWWNRVCHWQTGGSGPSYLSGWICAFMPFQANYKAKFVPEGNGYSTDKDGNRVPPSKNEFGFVDTSDIPQGYVSFPISINDQPLEFQAGFFGIDAVLDEYHITPALDWRLVVARPKVDHKFYSDGVNFDVCGPCYEKAATNVQNRVKEITFPCERGEYTFEKVEDMLDKIECDVCRRRFDMCIVDEHD